jgi:hypothetical protein
MRVASLVSWPALALAAVLVIATAPACTALLADAPCESSTNCPGGAVCLDGKCKPEALADDDGPGEGEGDVGEGEGEGGTRQRF